MITTAPPARGMRIECQLRDRVEAAYRRARTTVYDVRPHDQPGPLAPLQQQALDDLHEAEQSLVRFRNRGHAVELPSSALDVPARTRP